MQKILKEEFEELKMKVKPKIIGAARFLADAEKEIRDFQKNHEADGK